MHRDAMNRVCAIKCKLEFGRLPSLAGATAQQLPGAPVSSLPGCTARPHPPRSARCARQGRSRAASANVEPRQACRCCRCSTAVMGQVLRCLPAALLAAPPRSHLKCSRQRCCCCCCRRHESCRPHWREHCHTQQARLPRCHHIRGTRQPPLLLPAVRGSRRQMPPAAALHRGPAQ